MKNIFAQAKVIEAKPAKSKKDDKTEVRIAGLEDYAIICDLVKNLTTIKETVGETVKNEMRKIFASSKTKPENFRGIDGKASASCEMRKRSSTSPLTPEEVELLSRNSIPFDTVAVTEERYVINPAYMNDQKLLEKISEALSKVKGLPDDFIMLQKGTEKSIVSDRTIEKVFECGLGESLIDTVAVLAIKPKMDNVDVSSALNRARAILELDQKKGSLQ